MLNARRPSCVALGGSDNGFRSETSVRNNNPLSPLLQVLALPPLMHYAVQSTHDTPTDPMGNGKMAVQDWMLPIEMKLKAQSLKIDKYLRLLVPPGYLMTWGILLLAYFVGNE